MNFFYTIKVKVGQMEGEMDGITGRIEQFLLEQLDFSGDGILEIGRNELAQQFNCAPSQINYVLTTRFTPYKGYYIESRRGGSGFIRIMRLERSAEKTVENLLYSIIKDEITCDKARHVLDALFDQEALTEHECKIMKHAIDDNALRCVPMEDRNSVRAQILKNMLLVFLR